MADGRKVAVVTGGAGGEGGLGLTTSEALARQGVAVAVWDSSAAAIAAASAELAAEGLDVHFQQLDVSDPAQVRAAHAEVQERFGEVEILVNNAAIKMAGVLGPKEVRGETIPPFWTYDPAMVLRMLEVNVVAPFVTTAELVPGMIELGRGSIVNIVTSQHTERNASHIPYGPSKAALEAMTVAMAQGLDGTGVRVNAVLPGGSANRRGEDVAGKTPYDTMVAPILFLASDEGAAISGQVIAGTDFRSALASSTAQAGGTK